MNTQGLSGINFAEPGNHDLQQSSLSGLFKTPPTHTTFIDGYWEREVAFIMWPALILKGVWSIIFLVGLGIVFFGWVMPCYKCTCTMILISQ